MLNIKKILFPTDYSPSAKRALSHAGFLQDWFEAELHVVNVKVIDESDDLDMSEQPLLTEEELAEQLHITLDQKNTDPYINSIDGNADSRLRQVEIKAFREADAIINYVEENDIDLVVMGTHGRRGVKRFMLGSVTEEVVRLAPCPVLSVSLNNEEEPSKQTIRRILVPVDFSEHTRASVHYAVEFAQTFGAQIDLLHICNPGLFVSPYAVEFDYNAVKPELNRAEKMLAELAEEEIGFEHVVATVELGHPTTHIIDYARDNEVDLIVIPTHGRSGFQRIIMGSVAEKIVRMAPCPVFTIKNFGKLLLPEKATKADARRLESTRDS